MDFKDIGLKRFLKNYVDQHILEKALKDAYEAGYEDGWRDKHAKKIHELPKNILFVFEQSDECISIISSALINNVSSTNVHQVSLDNGTTFYSHPPIRIERGILCGLSFNKVFIDSALDNKKEIEQNIVMHLVPKNSSSAFVSFDEFKAMNLKEI